MARRIARKAADTEQNLIPIAIDPTQVVEDSTQQAQPEQARPEQAEPEQAQPEQDDSSDTTAVVPAQSTNLQAMPSMDAPALSVAEPELSYKPDFTDKSQWYVSADGGVSKQAAGTNAVGGAALDFCLQVSAAKGRPGFDNRLRIAFQQADGKLAEVNLNAVNIDMNGVEYVTSPGRSAVGALLAISESEDDMQAFTDGARFRLRPGRGKGVFVEIDIACNGNWVAMASAAATTQVPKDVEGYYDTLDLIKARFRRAGLLLTSRAVMGESIESRMVDATAKPAD